MKILVNWATMKKVARLEINTTTNQSILNGENFSLDIQNFSKKLIKIVSSWEKEMINPYGHDGISYSVWIKDGDINLKYVGKNKFPNNFSEFLNLLEEAKIC